MPDTRKDLLTDTAIKAARPRTNAYKLRDGGGLHLMVRPDGRRFWRFRYGHGDSETMLSFGVYPAVTLRAARARRDEARKQVSNGIDPGAARRAKRSGSGQSFAAVADDWLAMRMQEVAAGQLAEATVDRDRRQLRRWVNPEIGKRPINGVTTQDVLKALKKIESRGKHDTTHRTRETLERIFEYARRSGLIHDNPADAELFEGVFASRASTSYAAVIEPRKVGQLLRAIEAYDGQPSTRAALQIAPYVFVRPGVLRAAEWSEIELGKAEWRVPASRMKMRDPLVVPLARQVVKILTELHRLTGSGRYLFPAIGSGERPLSNGTLNGALRRLGYESTQHTPHGFRSTASTLLNEMGVAPDLIEKQLAHTDSSVRAIYNRSTRLDERRRMMQKWADRLDELRESGSGAEPSSRKSAR